MPTYDYYCDANGQTIEVKHSITVVLDSWGALCKHAAIDVGDTDPTAPVKRKIFGGILALPKRSGGEPATPTPTSSRGHTCGHGGCCH